MKTEYYCEIPWSAIWREFNRWVDKEQAGEWEEQQIKLQKVIQDRIDCASLRWHPLWQKYNKWWEINNSYRTISWREQLTKVKHLVQEEADFQVNQ